MITRPLDLASKLRPEPQSFDFLFFVNGGLIVLFFFLFGSRFVLAPGLGLDFQIQAVPGARSGAARTTHQITVKSANLIFTEEGPADLKQLGEQLKRKIEDMKKVGNTSQPSLLIVASNSVPSGQLAEIAKVASAAGFEHVQWAAEEPTPVKH